MFQSVWKKLKSSFQKLRAHLGSKIKALFSKPVDETSYEQLEKLLFEADLGSSLSLELVDKVRAHLQNFPQSSQEDILDILRKELTKLLIPPPPFSIQQNPHIILIVGVNGSGKTTSIAKLARNYKKEGKKVLIAACDTFRAAAMEQMHSWAKRIGVDLIQGKMQSDPSAVVFDALTSALAKNYDVVLIDTAGRLHTKTDLMKELEKIKRVCQKKITSSPHQTLLVLDATTGQNALDQARIFHQFTPIQGIILTKIDGSAKGGIIAAIKREENLDVLWLGTGEKEEDLVPFEPSAFIDALLE